MNKDDLIDTSLKLMVLSAVVAPILLGISIVQTEIGISPWFAIYQAGFWITLMILSSLAIMIGLVK